MMLSKSLLERLPKPLELQLSWRSLSEVDSSRSCAAALRFQPESPHGSTDQQKLRWA